MEKISIKVLQFICKFNIISKVKNVKILQILLIGGVNFE